MLTHNLRIEKGLSRIRMRGDALQERQSIADTVRSLWCERGRRQEWINGDNLLQERRDGPDRVPQNGSEIGEGLSFLG